MADRESLLVHYRRGLGNSARNNTLAYGYSVAITGSFGLLVHFEGNPGVVDVILFGIGASIAFAVVNVVVTEGFQQPVEREPRVVMALATSVGAVSISAALGVAALAGWLLSGWLPWVLAPLAASLAYLLTAAGEVALARRAHLVAGTDLQEEDPA